VVRGEVGRVQVFSNLGDRLLQKLRRGEWKKNWPLFAEKLKLYIKIMTWARAVCDALSVLRFNSQASGMVNGLRGAPDHFHL
jgi:hypothetical protein